MRKFPCGGSVNLGKVRHRITYFVKLYSLRYGWSVNLRAIESCICSLRCIQRKMGSILRTVNLGCTCSNSSHWTLWPPDHCSFRFWFWLSQSMTAIADSLALVSSSGLRSWLVLTPLNRSIVYLGCTCFNPNTSNGLAPPPLRPPPPQRSWLPQPPATQDNSTSQPADPAKPIDLRP